MNKVQLMGPSWQVVGPFVEKKLVRIPTKDHITKFRYYWSGSFRQKKIK